jgi:hypothetical protein
MTPVALLFLRDAPEKCLPLNPAQPLTIGRASTNRLALPTRDAVSKHHAVVRFSRRHGWLVCDWQSSDGTYLEGERVHRCRAIGDGDEIRIGRAGPVLVFRLLETAPVSAAAHPVTSAATTHDCAGSIAIGSEMIGIRQIRAAKVLSEPCFPHIFSWWALLSVGLLLLLPIRLGPVWIFWPLELTALVGAVVLGSRKEHTLVVELRDGQARRHRFSNSRTALAHRNGIRTAISRNPAPARGWDLP